MVSLVTMAEGSARRLVSVSFEVYGKVQGVFFRKYTKSTAEKQGLVGWVMNTKQGTVVGQLQGAEEVVKQMKLWLRKTGSPKSRIDKCNFTDEKPVEKYDFVGFDIVKETKSKKR